MLWWTLDIQGIRTVRWTINSHSLRTDEWVGPGCLAFGRNSGTNSINNNKTMHLSSYSNQHSPKMQQFCHQRYPTHYQMSNQHSHGTIQQPNPNQKPELRHQHTWSACFSCGTRQALQSHDKVRFTSSQSIPCCLPSIWAAWTRNSVENSERVSKVSWHNAKSVGVCQRSM